MSSASIDKITLNPSRALARSIGALAIVLCAGLFLTAAGQLPEQQRCLPPNAGAASLQQQIEIQQRRLSSSDVEERRCAVMSLGWMDRADSSRVAAAGLRDSAAIVRATTARAVLSLPQDEAAAVLLPLLNDRDEFVRQETAYALGETHSRRATAGLLGLLEKEKADGVRGAIVVSLGLLRDETAVVALTQLLDLRLNRRKKNENEFVRRAAVIALGQIGSRAALPSLVAALSDVRAPNDVRREAARSLGLIGDTAAIAPLRSVLASPDPHLSRIAYEALLKISPAEATRPT